MTQEKSRKCRKCYDLIYFLNRKCKKLPCHAKIAGQLVHLGQLLGVKNKKEKIFTKLEKEKIYHIHVCTKFKI